MARVDINEKYDPDTAIFWARFATEIGLQERHCPTVALYENPDGEFFAVDETRSAPNRSLPRTGASAPTSAELIADPKLWLAEHVQWLEGRFG